MGGTYPIGWVNTLESIHGHQKNIMPSYMNSQRHSLLSSDGKGGTWSGHISAPNDLRDSKFVDVVEDDDVEIDLLQAALDTGNRAFEAREWKEAESLLQEALKILQRLSPRQCSLFNVFSLHYKLAVCAYYAQDTAVAEEALTSFVQQPASTDEQLECIYNATHLLSQLFIQTGQVDRARVECDKAFKARRRLLGKLSDASLESMALMAHIHVLLNKRALAKSYLAMIPEERRDCIVENVENALGPEIQHLDFSTLLKQSSEEISTPTTLSPRSRISTSTMGSPNPEQSNCSEITLSNSPAGNSRPGPRRILFSASASQSVSTLYQNSTDHVNDNTYTEKESFIEDDSASRIPVDLASLRLVGSQEGKGVSKNVLSRKEILDKIGCQPRDRIEEAVCNSDYSSLTSLLSKRTNSWRSKIRKHARSERVTALHFAALFGEIDMARSLISANFSVNEIPYGYSTNLTPLTFAIGARQVDMVQFLLNSGARPSEPDTWSTLAAQPLSRSWLIKTMSEADKESVAGRIIAILSLLLQNGWDVNLPYEASSGNTLLHQAVSFWTGTLSWDLMVRAAICSFLCNEGADPFQPDREGRSPFDKVTASGDEHLVQILQGQYRAGRRLDYHVDHHGDVAELAG